MPTLVPHARRAELCAAYPITAQRTLEFHARVALVFTAPPTRFMFFVTELQAESDDLVLFGYCLSPLTPDADAWTVRRLSELENVRLRNLRVQTAAIPPGAYTVRELLDRGEAAGAP
jgi:hypothetical protein